MKNASIKMLALALHILIAGFAYGQSVAPKEKNVPGFDSRTLAPSPEGTPVLKVGGGETLKDPGLDSEQPNVGGDGAQPMEGTKGQSPTNPDAKAVPGFDPRTVDPSRRSGGGSEPSKGGLPSNDNQQPEQTK